jgi:hypothetical protein
LNTGPEKQNDAGINDIIEAIGDECGHVYDSEENGAKLDQLIADAQEFSDVDPKGWQELLKATKQDLVQAEDDAEAITDILKSALTKAATELM